MIEKLKSLVETMKNLLLGVVAPILFIGGIIYALMSKGEKPDQELERKAKEAEKGADDAEAEYRRLRDSYVRGDNGDSRE